MNKFNLKYFIGISFSVILILSCKVSKNLLNPPINLTKCNEIKSILLKNYTILQANMNRCEFESLGFDFIYSEPEDYDEIIDKIPDLREREVLKFFFKSKNLKQIFVRDTTCVSFYFRSNYFLIWYKFQSLVYHSPELGSYGYTDRNPEKCRLAPSFSNRKKNVILKERLDSNWFFFVGKDRYGPPS